MSSEIVRKSQMRVNKNNFKVLAHTQPEIKPTLRRNNLRYNSLLIVRKYHNKL